jgi:hypothetical protein
MPHLQSGAKGSASPVGPGGGVRGGGVRVRVYTLESTKGPRDAQTSGGVATLDRTEVT